jgi:phage repressor protein C with HTH and peptisase S24 domain
MADLTGFSGPSSIQRYETESRHRQDWVDERIIQLFGQALVGKGNPPISEDDVRALGYRGQAAPFVHKKNINASLRESTFPSAPANAMIPQGSGAIHFHRRIPLYGQAIGGLDGQFILNGQHIGDVIAPAALDTVKDAYAVSIVGDSMEPRYEAGEVVFVNPHVPIRKNDYVVIQIIVEGPDVPAAYVKRFVKLTEYELVVSQFNPPKEISFARDSLVSVHRIIMAGERG